MMEKGEVLHYFFPQGMANPVNLIQNPHTYTSKRIRMSTHKNLAYEISGCLEQSWAKLVFVSITAFITFS
jgi:hypothetical protein